MLKNTLPMTFSAAILIAVFSTNTVAGPEESQQEESFSQPIQKLTGQVGNIPVYSHIYGANFMTELQRCEYLLKLDNMKTKEERDEFRTKHKEKIDLRRKQEGG